MRLGKTDDIHSAIRKMCEKSTRAGAVVLVVQREFPDRDLEYMHLIDSKGLYGDALADFYFKTCDGSLDLFVKALKDV